MQMQYLLGEAAAPSVTERLSTGKSIVEEAHRLFAEVADAWCRGLLPQTLTQPLLERRAALIDQIDQMHSAGPEVALSIEGHQSLSSDHLHSVAHHLISNALPRLISADPVDNALSGFLAGTVADAVTHALSEQWATLGLPGAPPILHEIATTAANVAQVIGAIAAKETTLPKMASLCRTASPGRALERLSHTPRN